VAAEAAVYALDELVSDGTDIRTQLQRALIGGEVASEIIGAFYFEDDGNTSDRRVGIYRADSQGKMQLYTVLSPPKVLGAA
jgi:ABC-type branched-subunit amino acid transport system substrate-binding protein